MEVADTLNVAESISSNRLADLIQQTTVRGKKPAFPLAQMRILREGQLCPCIASIYGTLLAPFHAVGVKILEGVAQLRRAAVTEIAIGQHFIPNREALDKLLRYETAAERSLGRALDRIERLQRRRKGEPVPPPVSVRMTQ